MNCHRSLTVIAVLFYLSGCECNPTRTIAAGVYSGTWTIDPSRDNIASVQTFDVGLTITNKIPHCSDESSWWTFDGMMTVTQADQTAVLTLNDAIDLGIAGSFRFFVDIDGTFLQDILPSPIDLNPDDPGDTLLEIRGDETNGTATATALAVTAMSPDPTYGTFNLTLQ